MLLFMEKNDDDDLETIGPSKQRRELISSATKNKPKIDWLCKRNILIAQKWAYHNLLKNSIWLSINIYRDKW